MYAFASRPIALVIGVIGIIFGVCGIAYLQLQYLIQFYNESLIPGEVSLEENVAIAIAAFGVFLENRHRILTAAQGNDLSQRDIDISELCQKIGFPLLLLGILIEVVDLIFLALYNYGWVSHLSDLMEVGFLFLLNAFALFLLTRFLIMLLGRMRSAD